MMDNKPRNQVEADWEIVEGFQRQDEEVQKDFYRCCLSYFKEKAVALFDFYEKASTREDLFHEAFLRIWEEMENGTIRTRNRKVYRLDRHGVEREMTASLLTFFMSIAKNRNLEMMREEEWCSPLSVDVEETVMEEDGGLLMERIMSECVLRLPQRCRDILTKFYYQNMSLDEILASRDENMSKDGLKTGKSKCMNLLKKHLLIELKKYKLKE